MFKSIGSGTYNTTVVYNDVSNGLWFDLSRTTDVVNGTPIDFAIGVRGSPDTRMIIKGSTGNVGIGTNNPGSNYKLAVEGTIGARKVKVTTQAWADYVFEKDYRLPTLQEVELYIGLNKHLPDVPSANEIEKNGLDLGDNQATLLKKIEELTLYIIEQNKKIEALNKRVDEQDKKYNHYPGNGK